MIYLTGASNPASRDLAARLPSKLGLLVQPGNSYHRSQLGHYQAWAIDNGCFGKGAADFDLDFYLEDYLPEAIANGRCPPRFATAPDVVGDHAATIARSADALQKIRTRGAPAALVAQNGAEHDPSLDWDSFDVLFLGGIPECSVCGIVPPLGSTGRCPVCECDLIEWKEGAGARRLVKAARRRSKAVHMGRVNSKRRLSYAASIDCCSADGTYLAFGPSINTPKLEGWLLDL